VVVQAKGKKGGRMMARFLFGVFFIVCFVAGGHNAQAEWRTDGTWRPNAAMGSTLTRQGLIEEIADFKKIPVYDAEKDWEATQFVLEALWGKGVSASVRGHGKWQIVKVEARYYTNPNTGEKILVPAYNTVKWYLSDSLKEKIKVCLGYNPQDCELFEPPYIP
jgi:nucleoid DNA-binding protein